MILNGTRGLDKEKLRIRENGSHRSDLIVEALIEFRKSLIFHLLRLLVEKR
ncbi:MAG: hypothetical protein Phog2KO_48480 [Phototrophicaceae bacterium]